jgi:hypothetical protein
MQTQLRIILGALLIATAASAHEAAFPHEHGPSGPIVLSHALPMGSDWDQPSPPAYSGWNDAGGGVAAVRDLVQRANAPKPWCESEVSHAL